jgi:hypothetical protein
MHQMMAFRHLAHQPGDGMGGSVVLVVCYRAEKSMRGKITKAFLVHFEKWSSN